MGYYFSSNPYWFIRVSPTPTKIYLNPDYNIKFYYPEHWVKIPGYEERYGSNGAFFQISAISGGNLSLDQVAGQEAFHQLEPYGSRPVTVSLRIQGQPARMILPSTDQPREMMKQAALIVTYPWPIQIAGKSYEYFILWADVFHIRIIAQSLQFLRR
ncbi:peptidase M56 [Clostridium sp. DJ247]|uniref:peptidase M56 n=1 Tax=Clostridium sp. DJ247 TaxID=2726188 RepID=UPI001626DB1E|nr:peptidase M56 [Clostridium sp. DJ247]MBC2581940.1 peptidase M56 [Clostridium sp. DJ247]